MSTMTLKCRACRAALTKPLVEATTEEDVASAFVHDTHHWSVVTQGYVLHLTKPVRETINREYGWALDAFEVWVHPEDLTNGVTLVDGHSTNCCGPDGFEGPNRQCACGALVGTEQSECFQNGIFLPDETATYWQMTEEPAKVERAS